MRISAADRQRRPLQMTDGDLQNRFLGRVVDRQIDVDRFDAHVAHDAGPRDVELAAVLCHIRFAHDVAVALLQQGIVIGVRCLHDPFDLVVGGLVDRADVGRDSAGLVVGIPPVADRGIGDDASPDQEDPDEQHRGPCRAFFLPFFFCRRGGSFHVFHRKREMFFPFGSGFCACAQSP